MKKRKMKAVTTMKWLLTNHPHLNKRGVNSMIEINHSNEALGGDKKSAWSFVKSGSWRRKAVATAAATMAVRY
jgi:hypothetical protein